MAVYFATSRPQALLDEFDARLNASEEWKRIEAWIKNGDGSYTRSDESWTGKASMRPRVDEDRLTFNIVRLDQGAISSVVYSHYHGNLVEAFLRQLDLMFSMITSTPRCVDGDEWT
ncbi:hypothetical protein [Methylorubrum populi]|uniref:Uncharacterized protein n=1 Tax=Methylorubrum populi TaxID=223967 RepID=A0A833J0P4_9HYPH|nr:hypothetical protein [Methylorubrum populi]KAB7781974.1 hypothetical protein F8B43_5583 [Methylorubrum populi]